MADWITSSDFFFLMIKKQVNGAIRGSIENCFFLLSVKRGAGGSRSIQKSLSENTQIFLTNLADFGGSPLPPLENFAKKQVF